MRLLTLLITLVGAASASGQELQSILVTPRVQLEASIVEGSSPQSQAVVPQVAAQPQVIYVQPPQVAAPPQQSDFMRLYIFNQMMFNATYERRGILFPRYVRRHDAGARQIMVLRMFQQ